MKNGKMIHGEIDPETYARLFRKAAGIVDEIAKVSNDFPRERIYLAELIRTHSRMVCTNLQEAWQMKRQNGSFLAKLSDAAQAASKTQDCLARASRQSYIATEMASKIDAAYEKLFDEIFSLLCKIRNNRTPAFHSQIREKEPVSRGAVLQI